MLVAFPGSISTINSKVYNGPETMENKREGREETLSAWKYSTPDIAINW
jgi:hypothetical protein